MFVQKSRNTFNGTPRPASECCILDYSKRGMPINVMLKRTDVSVLISVLRLRYSSRSYTGIEVHIIKSVQYVLNEF